MWRYTIYILFLIICTTGRGAFKQSTWPSKDEKKIPKKNFKPLKFFNGVIRLIQVLLVVILGVCWMFFCPFLISWVKISIFRIPSDLFKRLCQMFPVLVFHFCSFFFFLFSFFFFFNSTKSFFQSFPWHHLREAT